MAYSPAPLVLDRSKPSPWNADGAFVSSEYLNLWRGLEILYPFWVEAPRQAFDIARKVTSTDSGSGTVTVTPSPLGAERTFDGGQAGFLVASDARWRAIFDGKTHATFWTLGKITTYGSGRRMFAKASGTDAGDILMGCQSTGDLRANIRIGGTLRGGATPLPKPPLGAYFHQMMVVRNGVFEQWAASADPTWNQPLALIDSNAASVGLGISFGTTNGVALAGKNGSETDTNRNLNGSLLAVGAWTQALAEPDLRKLVSDPLGLIRPNWDYVTAAGFTPVSLYATGDGTIVDVVNENDAASPLSPSIDDDPASPDDNDWVNNAVDVVP